MAFLGRMFRRGFQSSRVLKFEEKPFHKHAEEGVKLWRNLTFFVAFPGIALAMANAYISHTAHHEERPEFIPYEYMRIRTKKFPWGDGNHSFFHNKELNALPEGYEE
ncbi:cytochrome c oxidase subunit 6A1, mitochondrial-like [Lycorma delicatula]|uniref:cytochrome c oxidase subunit 6A1, mitochondrial-like n=1 Tax=Lycorma delicatula TaxID=130591 RepID=UPI003F510ABB